jgi:hypothetical protein
LEITKTEVPVLHTKMIQIGKKPEDDIELTLDGMNWGEMAFQEECPKIRIEEPPLIEIDSYLDKRGSGTYD